MRTSQNARESDWRPDAEERDENDITQPIRVICSRDSHPDKPRNPRERWFKEKEEPAVPHTPNWTEIGKPAA